MLHCQMPNNVPGLKTTAGKFFSAVKQHFKCISKEFLLHFLCDYSTKCGVSSHIGNLFCKTIQEM